MRKAGASKITKDHTVLPFGKRDGEVGVCSPGGELEWAGRPLLFVTPAVGMDQSRNACVIPTGSSPALTDRFICRFNSGNESMSEIPPLVFKVNILVIPAGCL